MTRSRLYLVLQAVVCVTLVALMAISAIEIYQEGSARRAEHPLESIYTPEDITGRFVSIAPLLFAGIGLLIAGLVLDVKDENAQKPVQDAALHRDLIVSRVAQPSADMVAERRKQKQLLWTGWALFTLCMVPILVHLLNPAHFPEADPEDMFFSLLKVLLPWTAAGLSALTVTSILREKSIHREAQAAQAQLKEETASVVAAASGSAVSPGKTGISRTVLIVLAFILIIAGVLNGSARDVLYKAITICTECVGLG